MKRTVLPAMLPLAACTGCIAAESQPYTVVAFADLAGIRADISGPIEILGSNSGKPDTPYDIRTVAAYRVHLPDSSPRHVRIYDTETCDVPTPPPGGCGRTRCPPFVLADLQNIQRVGDETHFFSTNVLVQGRRIDVDTGTTSALISLVPSPSLFGRNYVLGKVAVVQALDRDDGTPGEWLACGAFVAAPRN